MIEHGSQWRWRWGRGSKQVAIYHKRQIQIKRKGHMPCPGSDYTARGVRDFLTIHPERKKEKRKKTKTKKKRKKERQRGQRKKERKRGWNKDKRNEYQREFLWITNLGWLTIGLKFYLLHNYLELAEQKDGLLCKSEPASLISFCYSFGQIKHA